MPTRAVASLYARTTSQRARAWVTVWTVVLLFSGQGFRYLLGVPLYSVLVALTVAAVVVTFRRFLGSLRVPPLVGTFTALAALSVLWSQTRAVTALAAGVLAITTFIAVLIARGTSRGQFMAFFYRGLQVSLFAGLLFEMFVAFVVRADLPPLATDLSSIAKVDGGGEPILWSRNNLLVGGPIQGFVGNRNPFAAIALLTAIVAVIVLLERRIRPLDGAITLAAAVAVHLLTLSATVTVAAVYLTALTVAALVIRRVRPSLKRRLSFAVLACTAIVAVLTLKFRAEIFAMFDRGPDATNRTMIWDQVVHFAWQRPEGWGYVGYWPIWEEPYATIVDKAGVVAAHAHNAFLDAWLQLGLIGFTLLLVMVVLSFGSAWRLVERASRGDSYIPLGWALLTAALALQALTESRLLVEGGWFLLVVLYCSGPAVFTLAIVDPDLVRTGAPAGDEAHAQDPVSVLTRPPL
ncbi:O-antigen ligase family protein [Demequina sp. SYSU T00192]|uniref:O-antigen ligase family protein n=1 Tax=Demequina litoralis TaxID=3051660 RepID=A0ABT8G705_9MICO|nr:O-antigen ligase family protein [Demequina sp. SYSU T00192]MDN4474699.1 O-antigen ligase family protein [Demequina sp. SYSU T00192]